MSGFPRRRIDESTCGLDTYFIEYLDLPAGTGSGSSDPTGSLHKGLTALVGSKTLISSSDVAMGTYPGLQFLMEEPTSSILSNTAKRYGALYFVNDRLYVVTVATYNVAYSETRDKAFLQSFTAS